MGSNPCNLPSNVTQISLKYKSKTTLVFNDSNILPISNKQTTKYTPQEDLYKRTILQAIGSETYIFGEVDQLAKALKNRSLQGASDGSMRGGVAIQA